MPSSITEGLWHAFLIVPKHANKVYIRDSFEPLTFSSDRILKDETQMRNHSADGRETIMDAQTALRNYNARLSAFSDANKKGLEKPLEVFGDVMYTFAESLVGTDLAPEVTGCWITQYENHANGDHSKLAWAHML